MTRRTLPLMLALSALACGDKEGPVEETDAVEDTQPVVDEPTDDDGDGYAVEDDCDDNDAGVHPGATEACNGADDNCNGAVDEGFGDSDDDGTADCVDVEDCDGLDNDGDGDVDEDFGDNDGDGIADCLDGEECDGVDNNGDGDIDEGYDADGDGYTQCGSESAEADCDDGDAEVHPGQLEDGENQRDDDCDGLVDEHGWADGDLVINEIMNNPTAVHDPHGEWFEVHNLSGQQVYLNGLTLVSGTERWQLESDELLALEDGGYAVLGLDDDERHNGGVTLIAEYRDVILSNESDTLEIWADGVLVDSVSWDDGDTMPDTPGVSMSLDPWWTYSGDRTDPGLWCEATEQFGDGDWGSPGADNDTCPSFDHDQDGYTGEEGDCNDLDPAYHPGAVEVWYDGNDQDCAGGSDYDADGDGYDSDAYNGTDCDDTEPTVNPDALEYCDGLDNDCDGTTDPDTSEDAPTWYADTDGDGDGDYTNTTTSCSQPSGYVTSNTDCDDNDANVYDCALGITQSSPGDDCQDILNNGTQTSDGVYWIDPDGDNDPSDAFQVYCDMSTYSGGWTALYWVTADYFDGYYMNNRTSSSNPPTAVNTEKDIWNASTVMSFSEMLFTCSTQNDANEYYWYYNSTNPYTWFSSTTTTQYNYQNITSNASNTTNGTCMSTHKAEQGYGFVVIENGSCGSCNTMLFGMYHYTSGGGCNSTSTTYGSHTSPWDGSRTLQYPICGGQQTSNGTFMVLVR